MAALNYVVSKGATEEEDLLSVTLCTRGSTEAYLEKTLALRFSSRSMPGTIQQLSSSLAKGMGL